MVVSYGVRKYSLTYLPGENEKSRIQQIQECGASTISSNIFTECYAPVEFNWSGYDNKSFTGPSRKINGFGVNDGWLEQKWYPRMMADVNGDGLADVVGFDNDGVYVSRSTVTGFENPARWQSSFGIIHGWGKENPRMMADVDGDGLADVVGFGSDGVYVSFSTGTGFEAPVRKIDNFGYSDSAGGWRIGEHPRMMSDVNGDGLADVVGFGTAGVWVSLSTGTGFEAPVRKIDNFGYSSSAGGWRVEDHPRMMSDVNGDGLADVVGFGQAGVWVSLSTGTGFQASSLWVDSFGYSDSAGGWRVDKHPRMMSDVNGDGLPDVVGFANAGVHVSLSTGSRFQAHRLWVDSFGYSDSAGGWWVDKHPRMMSDVNGDGYADVVGFANAGVHVSLSTGSRFQAHRLWIDSFGYSSSAGGWRVVEHPRMMSDVNGDGLPDIVGFGNAGVYTATSANDSGKPKVISVTNGPKPETTIDYGYLTQEGEDLYSKGADVSTSTERTVVLPQSVVKSISIDNGIGGFNRSTYKYEDLRLNLEGRGIRGFRKFEVTDHANSVRTTRNFLRTHPYNGRLSLMTKEIFESLDTNNSLINPQPIETIDKSYTILASPLSSKVSSVVNDTRTSINHITGITETAYTGFDGTTRKIDDYGNVEWAQVSKTGHGQTHTRTVTSSYYPPDTVNWIVGSLQDATVVHHYSGSSADLSNTDISRSSRFTYYPNGQLHTETIEPNASDLTLKKITAYEYDNLYGEVSKITKTGWDKQGIQLVREVDINRIPDTFYGHPAIKQTTTNSLLESESIWVSQLHGGQIGHLGPNEKESRAEFDPLGRKTSETTLDVETLISYDWTFEEPLNSLYKVTQNTQGLSDHQTAYFDTLNRKIQVKRKSLDGRDVINQTVYDTRGLKEKISRPYLAYTNPVWICHSYDDFGRHTGTDSPGANDGSPNCYSGNRATATTDYDQLTITSTDELGHIKIETQNLLGQVARIDEAHGTIDHSWLAYTYDATGNLKTVTDANNKVTVLDYDNNGRKEKINDPAMGEWLYEYNSFDELTKQTDAKLQEVTIRYDAVGRMDKRTDGEGVWDWNYAGLNDPELQPIGKLKSISGPNGYAKAFEYTNNLQIRSITESQTLGNNVETNSQTITYDEFGRVGTQIFPEGFQTENEYNRYGHLVAVKSPGMGISPEAQAKLEAQKAEAEQKAAEAEALSTTYLNKAISYQSSAINYETYAMGLLRLGGADSSGATADEFYAAANKLRDISMVLIEKAEATQNEALASAAAAQSLQQEIKNGTASDTYNTHRFIAIEKAEDAKASLDKAHSIIDEIQSSGLSYSSSASMLNSAETYINLAHDSESPREFRRLFCVSHAASDDSSSC